MVEDVKFGANLDQMAEMYDVAAPPDLLDGMTMYVATPDGPVVVMDVVVEDGCTPGGSSDVVMVEGCNPVGSSG